MGLLEGMLVEEAAVLPGPHPRPHVPADEVVGLVAQHGGQDEQPHRQRQAHQPHAAQGAHHEQQRVARQERHDHHARLDEDDQEQQRVHPGAIGLDESRQVLVDMQDEVDQEGDEVHAGIIGTPFLQ